MTTTTINISAENIVKLNLYKQESFAQFADIEQAKSELKDIIETAAEATGLEKKIVNKYFSMSYKATLQDTLDEADLLAILSGKAVEQTV